MKPILAFAVGGPDLRGQPIILLDDGTSVAVGPNTDVIVDGQSVPRLCDDGADRVAALLAWRREHPAAVLEWVTYNPPHLIPAAVSLLSSPPPEPVA